MPIHSVLVVNRTGNVLFSKYFDPKVSSGGNHLLFQQDVFNHTNYLWHLPGKQTVTIDDVHVLYQRFGELIIFISGTYEIDEIILCEVLDCLERIIEEADAKSEKQFLEPEKYGTTDYVLPLLKTVVINEVLHYCTIGKWIIAIDEMMAQGFLENTDADRVLKMSKLKHF